MRKCGSGEERSAAFCKKKCLLLICNRYIKSMNFKSGGTHG